MGEDGRKVFPVLGGLFLFIAVQNILGLIPACDAPTANINTNIGMALFVFLYYNYQASSAGAATISTTSWAPCSRWRRS